MSMNIEGLEEFQQQIEQFKDEVEEARKRTPEAVDEGTKQTAKLLQSQMRENILRLDAYDTGELFESVTWTQVSSGTYAVGPTADHAVYIEYGTGIYAEKGGGSPITPKKMPTSKSRGEIGKSVV